MSPASAPWLTLHHALRSSAETRVHTYFVAEREGGAARSAGRIAETLGRA